MKWSTFTVGIMFLGIIGISIVLLFQKITTNNENDYYLLKETMEASMLESIDIPYYRDTGNLKIVKEKFVEDFARRYAASSTYINSGYSIKFFDIIDEPPKASVLVDNDLGNTKINNSITNYKIYNKLDGILEFTYKNNSISLNKNVEPFKKKQLKKDYYAVVKNGKNNKTDILLSLETPSELLGENIKNVKINDEGIINLKVLTNPKEINQSILNYGFYKNIDYLDFIEKNKNDLFNYNNYSNEINLKLDIQNCDNYLNNFKCNDYDKYLINVKGTSNNIYTAIKYTVTWDYDECIEVKEETK